MISSNPILYKNNMIYFKTGPIKVTIKGQKIIISFDILLLGKDKAVLKMPFLQKFNPRINWSIKTVEINNVTDLISGLVDLLSLETRAVWDT